MDLENAILDLGAIEKYLPKFFKEKFKKDEEIAGVVKNMNAINVSFVPILDHLVCFKSEIGLCLQRIVESFNILFL